MRTPRREDLAGRSAALSATFSLLFLTFFFFFFFCDGSLAQSEERGRERSNDQKVDRRTIEDDKFRQLEEILPTANAYRTASGAPGAEYWQQKVNYKIQTEIDEKEHRLTGTETITYKNNSPDPLRYLWLQLDSNIFSPDSDATMTAAAPSFDRFSFRSFKRLLAKRDFDGGSHIKFVHDEQGNTLPHTIVKTMMRIDLPEDLAPGETTIFSVGWTYLINNTKVLRARTGYEPFEEDGNDIFEIAHWFPRLVAYTDVNGWQHKQFLGNGEFTLEFGDYEVAITVPADHIVGATGVLQNFDEVLTREQSDRLLQARTADKPIFIVTPDEAKENEKEKSEETQTWQFHAKNVRDFAFATSRKFIWDALLHKVADQEVMAMSYYPKEGEPLWSKYSTHAIIHTLNVYSRYTFDYPYPVAISVNGPVGGMEYPMICFNGPRPEKDGTYTQRSKYGLISVIIHEVGHNYFPMIVNSDERQWTWMDEGINTFVQLLAEQEWEEKYPSRRGNPQNIVGYMTSNRQVPIMTNSESLLQFGNNAYAKPATALNILRETILGRELFDFAFKEYSRRWKFKRPMPADFFRTMEDASGVDLDWFWRGWFYTTQHTDIAITALREFEIDSQDPELEKQLKKEKRDKEPITLTKARNKDLPKRVDTYGDLKDFYNSYDALDVTPKDEREHEKYMKSLDDLEKELLKSNLTFYVVDLENLGGLVMPVILEVEYEDGQKEEIRIPAEIWRKDPVKVSRLILCEKKISSVTLDPHLETADANTDNNHFPPRRTTSRFKLFKDDRRRDRKNPMREQKQEEEKRLKKLEEEATPPAEPVKTEEKSPTGDSKES